MLTTDGWLVTMFFFLEPKGSVGRREPRWDNDKHEHTCFRLGSNGNAGLREPTAGLMANMNTVFGWEPTAPPAVVSRLGANTNEFV